MNLRTKTNGLYTFYIISVACFNRDLAEVADSRQNFDFVVNFQTVISQSIFTLEKYFQNSLWKEVKLI